MSIAECPRCGHHLATELKEGVPALQAEVRRLEELIPRLQEEKAILLRRINNAQEKTRRLPFEVLSNIFQFARPPIDFTAHEPTPYYIDDQDYPPLTGYYDFEEDFHYTLAAVSHRWRQVALSTPQLWTSISLLVLNTFTEFDTSLLDLHFKNARNFPISIQLDFSNPATVWEKLPSRRSDFLMRLEPLAETIFYENADKVRSLILIEPPAEWSSSFCGNLSHCNSVTIYWSNSELGWGSFFNFEDLPCLQHVKMSGRGFSFTLPPTVSALQLYQADLRECLQSLVELPNLVKLEITDAMTEARYPRFNDSAIKPIVLHLENLSWSAMHMEENYNFLRRVRFDNLRTLQWCEHTNFYSSLSEEGRRFRLAFFSSLPPTLSTLVFHELEIDAQSVVDLLYCVPQLTELYFTQCPQEVVVGVIKAIGRPLAVRGEPSSHLDVLSNLCVLSTSDTMSDARLDPLIFIEMLEALRDAGPRQKPFHLTTHSDVTWHSDALQQVRALLSSGLDAKVTFDSGESTSSIP